MLKLYIKYKILKRIFLTNQNANGVNCGCIVQTPLPVNINNFNLINVFNVVLNYISIINNMAYLTLPDSVKLDGGTELATYSSLTLN